MEDIIPWLKKYEFGIRIIDLQHRQLVQIINDLNIAIEIEAEPSIITDIISRLIRYTINHFQYEEELLERCLYTKTRQHKANHLKLRHEIIKASTLLTNNLNNNKVKNDLLKYLVYWFIHHVQDEDRDYIDSVLKNKKI